MLKRIQDTVAKLAASRLTGCMQILGNLEPAACEGAVDILFLKPW